MTIELTTAARVLATLRARNAVKDQIRRQGLKVHQYTAREITGWANVYLDEHPELIPEAMANARAMILKGLLGKRAQRQLRAKIESDAQSKIEPVSMASAVQMSGKLIGWQDQPETCSTLWLRLLRLAQRSSRSVILGAIQQRHMAS